MHENGKSRSSFEVFCLTVRKSFLGTTSKIQIFWDLGNFFAYHGFPSIFLSHSSEKFREDPSNVSESFKCPVSKKTYAKERNITTFSRKFFVSECRKISLGNTLLYQKSSAIEKFHA